MNLTTDTTRAKEDGSFAFRVLEPGVYAVTAEGVAEGDAPLAAAILRGVRVEADRITEDVDLALGPSEVLAGTVVDARGVPVEHAVVFAHDADGRPVNPVSHVRTDAEGRFAIPLATGSYRLMAWFAGEASLPVAASAPARPGPEPTLAVEAGALLDVGGADPQELITVTGPDGRRHDDLLDPRRPWDWLADGFRSDVQRFGPLLPGSYRVVARAVEGGTREVAVEIEGPGLVRVELP